MSKAREIAEERLAKGEISEEEFEHLLSKFAASNNKVDVEEQQLSNKTIEIPIDESSQKLGTFGKVVTWVIGLYLVACIVFAFLGARGAIEKGVYKTCVNKNHPFCKCQANNMRNQATFFKAPLLTFGIISFDPPANACRHLDK